MMIAVLIASFVGGIITFGQVLLTLFSGIPTTIKFQKAGFLRTRALYIAHAKVILLNIIGPLIVYWVVTKFWPKYSGQLRTGFLGGCITMIFFSFRCVRNDSILRDYLRAYSRFLKPGAAKVLGLADEQISKQIIGPYFQKRWTGEEEKMQLTDKQLTDFMKNSGMTICIEDLEAFPWSQDTYVKFILAIQTKQILLAVLYDPDARHTVLSSGEKMFTNILGNLIPIIPIAFMVAAIWTKQWLLLFGLPGFLIAAVVSSPWARSTRHFLMFLSIVGSIIGFWKLWPLGFVCLGLLISLWLAVFSREYVNAIVKRKVMKSETLFCYAYQAGILLLKDVASGKIYGK